MNRDGITSQFDPLSREQILALRPGTWDDFQLLGVMQYFERKSQRVAFPVTVPCNRRGSDVQL